MVTWGQIVPLFVALTSTYAALNGFGKFFRKPPEQTPRDYFGWILESIATIAAGLIGLVLVASFYRGNPMWGLVAGVVVASTLVVAGTTLALTKRKFGQGSLLQNTEASPLATYIRSALTNLQRRKEPGEGEQGAGQ